MKRYIKSDDEMDYGYGFDSNGDPIDESTVDEMYRIAENEILPKSELGEFGICTIDDDSFEYYATGTAWGSHLEYTIMFELDPVAFADRAREFSKDDDVFAMFIDLRDGRNQVVLRFDINVNGSKFDVELVDMDITENGRDASQVIYDSFDKLFSKRKIENFVAELAEPTISQIHSTLSNL